MHGKLFQNEMRETLIESLQDCINSSQNCAKNTWLSNNYKKWFLKDTYFSELGIFMDLSRKLCFSSLWKTSWEMHKPNASKLLTYFSMPIMPLHNMCLNWEMNLMSILLFLENFPNMVVEMYWFGKSKAFNNLSFKTRAISLQNYYSFSSKLRFLCRIQGQNPLVFIFLDVLTFDIKILQKIRVSLLRQNWYEFVFHKTVTRFFHQNPVEVQVITVCF